MLAIRELSKTYANGVQALDNVSLDIPRGMFGLLGPNGAGKSSLMRTLATLQEADSGSAVLDGADGGKIDVLREKDTVRRQLGYLPQDFGVYPKVSAEDMLDHLARLKGITNKGERADVVASLLRQTNLYDVRKKALGGYSGGMRQRFDGDPAVCGRSDALQRRHMVEHAVSGDARIDAEILRQIAKRPAKLFRLADDIDIAEPDRSSRRRLERRDRPH